jgi:hypothetical protein
MLADSQHTIEAIEKNCQTARRLSSLWEMMNQIDIALLAYMTSLFADNEVLQQGEKPHRRGVVVSENLHLKQLITILDHLENIFRQQRIVDCVEYCLVAKDILSKPSVDIASMSSSLITLKSSILHSLQKKKLLQVSQDQFEFLEEDALFGPAVKNRFPSASRDIKAAGDCFAAECSAAAVFHLMRVAEVGLRSLVRDRRVPLADRQLSDREWSLVSKKLEIAVFQLRTAPATRWRGADQAKERQVAFYSDLLQELRSFDEAWKNHVSHPGAAIFYSRDQAGEILKHVRSFMQKLTLHLSETSATEEFWSK